MKDQGVATWIIASLLVLYPVSYGALRLTHVLHRSFSWSCLSTTGPKSHVRGPRPLETVYQPLILFELALPRPLQLH